MKKFLFLIYGVAAYGIFFATYCYAVGFVTNLIVPTGLDIRPTSSLAYSLAINIGVLLLFSLQHSIMAKGEPIRYIKSIHSYSILYEELSS